MLETVQRTLDQPELHEEVYARLYGEPVKEIPEGLYIPPEALKVFLESFEGPLDLLLYLIRKQKFDVLDIPMAELTDQYMEYVELIRSSNLELAAAYLVMSATLMQIKSRLLLPKPPAEDGEEPEDPRAELMRRLLEYEKMRDAARRIEDLPRVGRDFWTAASEPFEPDRSFPDLTPEELALAWGALIAEMKLSNAHKVRRETLSIREHMSALIKRLSSGTTILFSELVRECDGDRSKVTAWFIAMLELAKDGLATISQAAPYAEIYIEGTAASAEDEGPNYSLDFGG